MDDKELAMKGLLKRLEKIKEHDERIEKMSELLELKKEIDTTSGRVSELDEQIAMVEEHITLAEEYITLEEEHKNTLHELQIENNKNTKEIAVALSNELTTVKSSGIELLGKKEVKRILDYKDDESYYRFMRIAVKDGYAFKLGKSYKITVKNFEKFLKHREGEIYKLRKV